MKNKFYFLLFCLVLLPTKSFAVTDKIYKELAAFAKVIQMVDQYYVEEVDEQKLIDGAIRGMLMSLDPHTVYFSEDVYTEFKADTEGHFGGLGMEVTIKDDYLTVISPIPDTPADRAGIRSGDKIVKIDDKSTKGMNLWDAVNLMRGPLGKKVKLTLYQQNHNVLRDVTLKREVIEPDPIAFEDLKDGYGYFRIKSFQEGVAKDLRKSIEDFVKEQDGNVKGILLDVRGNPGGLLTEAVGIVNLFVKSGVIVSTRGVHQDEEVMKANPSDAFAEKYPVALLIDGGSASASEIVAGALQDYKRATLYGTKSYGKGSVQTVFPMDKGDALKVTIARYYTPKNRMIDKKGIDPDVLLDQAAFKKKLEKELGKKIEGEPADDDNAPSTPKFTFSAYLEYQKQQALQGLKNQK